MNSTEAKEISASAERLIMKLKGGEVFRIGTVNMEVTGFWRKRIVCRHDGQPLAYTGLRVGGKVNFGKSCNFILRSYGKKCCVLDALPGNHVRAAT